jgi:uncharacterized protein (TIGR03435 family)
MVVNEAGLSGDFDVDMSFDPASGGATSSTAPSPAATIFIAVSDLGLRLESQSAAVDVLVIYHAERPTED